MTSDWEVNLISEQFELKQNESKNTFDEIPHEVKSLSDFLLSGNDDDFIEIVEYEDG